MSPLVVGCSMAPSPSLRVSRWDQPPAMVPVLSDCGEHADADVQPNVRLEIWISSTKPSLLHTVKISLV